MDRDGIRRNMSVDKAIVFSTHSVMFQRNEISMFKVHTAERRCDTTGRR